MALDNKIFWAVCKYGGKDELNCEVEWGCHAPGHVDGVLVVGDHLVHEHHQRAAVLLHPHLVVHLAGGGSG